jgi:hypothetical protein
MMRTKVIDLRDRVREIRDERIPSLEESAEELLDEVMEEYENYSEVPKKYKKTYREFSNKIDELDGEAAAIERDIGDADDVDQTPWDNGEILIEEFTAGEVAHIQDQVAEASFSVDAEEGEVDGAPREGYGEILIVTKAIKECPSEFPTDATGEPDAGELRRGTMEYLYDEINDFNSLGEGGGLGNSSLREAMKQRRG